jgi:hypothetical protein
VNSATSTPPIRQPRHLQPQNGRNQRLIEQFDSSKRFETQLETIDEVRAAKVYCCMPKCLLFSTAEQPNDDDRRLSTPSSTLSGHLQLSFTH